MDQENIRPAAPSFLPTSGDTPPDNKANEPVFLEAAVHVTPAFTPNPEPVFAPATTQPVPQIQSEAPTQPQVDDKPLVPSPLKQIRTFQGDIAEALKEKNASLYSLQQAEQKRTEA